MTAPYTGGKLQSWLSPRGPITWTGHGASLALADLIACVSRHEGFDAWCVPAEEARGIVGWVSRSGRTSGSAEVLVTECSGAGRRVVVSSSEPAGAWFPIGWQFAVLTKLAAAFGVTLGETAAPREPGILIVPVGARPIATLLDAAYCKIGVRPWVVCTPAEFRHGAFARAIADDLRIQVLGEAPSVVDWAQSVARTPVRVTPLSGTALPPAMEAYVWVLRGLEAITNTYDRPVPLEVDPLLRS